ncbi:ribonuclease H-like domain-containing protein [Tanacetum coccineum]
MVTMIFDLFGLGNCLIRLSDSSYLTLWYGSSDFAYLYLYPFDQCDNEVEGTNVEGAKSDEEATYEEDQGYEAVEDTNTDLEEDDVMKRDGVFFLKFNLPQVQATQEIEDTHVTLTLVNPDGQQQSSSVSSGFVSNMLNPNQDTGVDDIFRQHTEATSLIDTPVTAIMEPSFTAQINRPPTPIREESSTANQQFLDSIDEGMKKIIKEQVKKEVSKITPKIKKLVTDQLESEVLVRSSKEANTSHAVAANLSELNTYGDTVIIKRPRDGADDDQEPSAGTDRGSKKNRSRKKPALQSAPSETTTTTAGKTTSTGSKTHKKSASQSAPVEETMQTTDVFEAPAHQEFETGVHDEQAEEEVQHLPDWFQQPTRLPSPDHAWNKSVPAVHESVQPWLSNLAQQDPRESFDELTDSTFDFSAFVMNRLNVQTLTPELLAGPTFELMKGTCKSLTELEYFCEEVYKATTEKLDWINPEGRQYPHDLRQPLPLVPNSQGRRVIPFHHFINNDLEYLRGGVSSRKYSTSVTKTTAADYGHIKWIEDLVPNSMWSQMIVKYDKFALWGISHWGKKRRQFYAFATSRESARDVYSKRRIIAVTKNLLLLVQGKVTNLNVEERIAFNVSLRMFTRRVVIQRRVEDLQLGVESYQKKLNLTKPDTSSSRIRRSVVKESEYSNIGVTEAIILNGMRVCYKCTDFLKDQGTTHCLLLRSSANCGTNIQEKDKKKAKNKQNRARNGKDKVKSKSKVNQVKKIQLKGLKLPNLKLDDLVSKFINKFFPPSKTTNLRNEITRFQQKFDEMFYEAWDRFNDLLRGCPHHGFSELHQLDTFYNALNSNDQDSLNSVAGGNFLDKMPRECLKIIEIKSKVHQSRSKAIVSKVSTSSSTPAV